ncbi:MAG: hypothetical protein QNJ70_28175 [Xenococcaceae cyanobacterium MO_207.B15]|nr:hypothetical protein [Xenococcaceae cyanobacterium MO_207.B15]
MLFQEHIDIDTLTGVGELKFTKKADSEALQSWAGLSPMRRHGVRACIRVVSAVKC